ncbi:MAG: XRE family transcriptional regulator [Candidatus Binataceae bacterium]
MSTSNAAEQFQRRLRLIMQQFGSVADLARAVGVSDNAIYKWVTGRGQPSMVSLVNLATAAGVSVEWLATGRGVQLKGKPLLTELVTGAAPQDDAEQYFAGARQVPQAPGQPFFEHQQIVDYLGFKASWLRRVLNADAHDLVLIEAMGDAMAPTIKEGDLVLADLRGSRFRFDGVYLLRAGAELVVKRLQHCADGALSMRGDNPAYQAQEVRSEAITIVGRVVWIGGRA